MQRYLGPGLVRSIVGSSRGWGVIPWLKSELSALFELGDALGFLRREVIRALGAYIVGGGDLRNTDAAGAWLLETAETAGHAYACPEVQQADYRRTRREVIRDLDAYIVGGGDIRQTDAARAWLLGTAENVDNTVVTGFDNTVVTVCTATSALAATAAAAAATAGVATAGRGGGGEGDDVPARATTCSYGFKRAPGHAAQYMRRGHRCVSPDLQRAHLLASSGAVVLRGAAVDRRTVRVDGTDLAFHVGLCDAAPRDLWTAL